MKRAFSKKNLWDNCPAPVKAVAGFALSKVPLPWILGGEFRRWYRFALNAERWDAERVRTWQLNRLRQTLALAYTKSEFYRESFRNVGFQPEDLKTLEDLQKLPTIDKTTVRENWQRMLTRPVSNPSVDLVTTGGTNGEPLKFYMARSRHAPEFAHLTAFWSRVGFRPGDTMAVLRGRVIPNSTNGVYHQFDPLFRYHYYSTFHMSPDDLRKYAFHIQRIQPKFLHAYPSSLYALARFMAGEGLSFPKTLQAALLESEPVFSHQVALVQERMGLRMFSCYGHSEKLVMAGQCEHSSNYHVAPGYGICEVLGHSGPVSIGEEGEITGTGFINEVMPFIRYRTGDRVSFVGDRCAHCGRVGRQLGPIQGRWGQEFLVCRDGHSLVFMTSLNLHDDTFEGVLRFQFVQDEPGIATLKLVAANESVTRDAGRFLRHFAPKLAHGVELRVEFVSEIPLTRVGKQPMILQRCPNASALLRGLASESPDLTFAS